MMIKINFHVIKGNESSDLVMSVEIIELGQTFPQ